MQKLKVLNGRVAIPEDVEAGNVVFYIPDSRSTPHRFHKELPLRAKLLSNTIDGLPAGSEVTIVQAEQTDDGNVLLGFMFDHDGEGVCQLEEVELIDDTAGRDDHDLVVSAS